MKGMKAVVSGKAFRIKDCRGFASVRGLMFDSLSQYDGALVSGNSIWMPFVRSALQLVFMDRRFAVTSVQHAEPLSLRPRTWRVYSDKSAAYCLELAEKVKVSKGTRIKIL